MQRAIRVEDVHVFLFIFSEQLQEELRKSSISCVALCTACFLLVTVTGEISLSVPLQDGEEASYTRVSTRPSLTS